jgi:hypothetical protein
MPLYRVDVANIFYLTLPAESEDDARKLALHRIDEQRGHEQRVLKIEQVEGEMD